MKIKFVFSFLGIFLFPIGLNAADVQYRNNINICSIYENTNSIFSFDEYYTAEEKIENPKHFILTLNDGSRVAFLLDDNPKIINYTDKISIMCKDLTIEYPLTDIHKYTMGTDDDADITTAIEDGISDSEGSISSHSGAIILTGFTPGAKVTIVNINGMVLFDSEINVNGQLLVNIGNLQEGIYIVKAKSQTFKFIKR